MSVGASGIAGISRNISPDPSVDNVLMMTVFLSLRAVVVNTRLQVRRP